MKQKEFRITWSIDVSAATVEEAVAKAILAMPVPMNEETVATVFETCEIVKGKLVNPAEIDTLELDEEERSRFVAVLDGYESYEEFVKEQKELEEEGTEGQDRESYSDDQDRDNYTVNNEEDSEEDDPQRGYSHYER